VLLDTPILNIVNGKITPDDSHYNDIGEVEWDGNNVEWEGNNFEWQRLVELEEYSEDDLGKIEIFYRHPGVTTSTIITNDGTILKPKYNPTFIPSVSFTLEKDRWGNYKLFNIERVRGKHILYATKVQEGGLITNNSYLFDAYYLVPKDAEAL
jgi:hypothetical protein